MTTNPPSVSHFVEGQVLGLLMGALAFVSALAWNDMFVQLFKRFSIEKWGPFIYALCVTGLTILVVVLVAQSPYMRQSDTAAKITSGDE